MFAEVRVPKLQDGFDVGGGRILGSLIAIPAAAVVVQTHAVSWLDFSLEIFIRVVMDPGLWGDGALESDDIRILQGKCLMGWLKVGCLTIWALGRSVANGDPWSVDMSDDMSRHCEASTGVPEMGSWQEGCMSATPATSTRETDRRRFPSSVQ